MVVGHSHIIEDDYGMLFDTDHLQGYQIAATDGLIGAVEDVLFDDARWAVRYLVVNTGAWVTGRRVLLTPDRVTAIRWEDQIIRVPLSRQQLTDCPDAARDPPVSRQMEARYGRTYGYLPAWASAALGGVGMYGPFHPPADPADHPELPSAHASSAAGHDPHLHSVTAVTGYRIWARDGVGDRVAGLLADDRTWALRYLVVTTNPWRGGKLVLIDPAWVRAIAWATALVHVDLACRLINAAPAYAPGAPLTGEEEAALHRHYQRGALNG